MIEMKVNGLAIDSASKMPVVILTDKDEKRFLPIWIGVYEADAILVALENIDVPRPMTHDLIRTMLDTMEIVIDRVVIHDIKNNTFFANRLKAVRRHRYGSEDGFVNICLGACNNGSDHNGQGQI